MRLGLCLVTGETRSFPPLRTRRSEALAVWPGIVFASLTDVTLEHANMFFGGLSCLMAAKDTKRVLPHWGDAQTMTRKCAELAELQLAVEMF